MGVTGLSLFIRENPGLGQRCSWGTSASEQETQFIVDGNAFAHYFANQHLSNWVFGGQYASVSDVMEQMIRSLEKALIKPTFLFDGALPFDKQETRAARYRGYINRVTVALSSIRQINDMNRAPADVEQDTQYWKDMFVTPPLMMEVCIQTLRKLGYNPIVCEGEADGKIAAMADACGGYVLSKDSDMHVYPHVGKGYIPLDTLTVTPLEQDSQHAVVSAIVYHPDTLAGHLRIEPGMLPLFGALLGNDYISSQLVKFPIMEWCASTQQSVSKKAGAWPKTVAAFLRHHANASPDQLTRAIVNDLYPRIVSSRKKEMTEQEMLDAIDASIRRYDPQSPLVQHPEAEQPTLPPSNHTTKLESLSRAITDVVESRTFWTVVFLEDLSQDPAWLITRTMRQYLYFILDHQFSLSNTGDAPLVITEYIRCKQHTGQDAVQSLPLTSLLPKGQTLDDALNDQYLRRQLFQHMHNISDETAIKLSAIRSDLKALVLCLRYLVHHAYLTSKPLKNHELVGLIAGSLNSLRGQTQVNWTKLSLKVSAIHLTAQFQSVIFCSYIMAQALDLPEFYPPSVFIHLYNGLLIHRSLQQARKGNSIGRILAGNDAERMQEFQLVYDAIIEGLRDKVEMVQDISINTSATSSSSNVEIGKKRLQKNANKRQKTKKQAPSQSSANGNAFSVLSFGCSFDDD